MWNETVTGGMLGASGSFPVGPVTLAGNLWFGQNVGTFGMYHQTADDPLICPTLGLDDTDSWGGILVANFKSTDMLSFELGVGYTESDNDTFLGKDDALAYYGNAVVTIAPGFFIVPEIGVQDSGDDSLGLKEGKIWYRVPNGRLTSKRLILLRFSANKKPGAVSPRVFYCPILASFLTFNPLPYLLISIFPGFLFPINRSWRSK